MRINGGGTGGAGADPRRQPGTGRERETFRKRHAVGDRLRGVVLEIERPGLAWIRIDGLRLLASLQAQAAPGQVLHFTVKALSPDILLQELDRTDGGQVSIAAAARMFLAERAGFESLAAQLGKALAAVADPEERRREFLRGLPEAALAGLARLRALESDINAQLAGIDGGRFFYLPWLMPLAREVELLLPGKARRPSAEANAAPQAPRATEAVLSFRLERTGPGEIRALVQPGAGPEGRPRLLYRILLERPDKVRPIEEFIASWVASQRFPDAECLGVGLLPRTETPGVLARLAAAALRYGPGLERCV